MGHVDVLSALWEDGQCRWPGHVDIQCVPCCPLNMGLHGQTQHRYILAVSCQLVAILDNPRMAKAKNCVFKLNFSSTNLYIQIKALFPGLPLLEEKIRERKAWYNLSGDNCDKFWCS